MKKVPKRTGYVDGGPTKYVDIKKGDALPQGAVLGPAPGAGTNPSGKIVDENGKTVGYYHIPAESTGQQNQTVAGNDIPSTNTTPSATGTLPAATGTTAAAPAPAVAAKPAPTRADQRAALKKSLDAWQSASAQKVPTEIVNEIQNNIRPNVQAKQAILDAATAKKYGTKSGPVKGQQLSYDEAAKALGGKEAYDDFLQDIYHYEAYRAKTKGTYDTQNVTWGATDPNEKMYGFRMSNMFKNTPEQSAANTKKTAQNVLDWQKNPTMASNSTMSKPDGKTILLDNNNEAIPVMQYDKDGKPIIPEPNIQPTGFKSGGKVKLPKGYIKMQAKADGGKVERAGLTPEQRVRFDGMGDEEKKQFLASLSGGVGEGAGMVAKAAGDGPTQVMSQIPYAAIGQLGAAGVNSIDVDPDNNKGVIAQSAGASALKGAGIGAQLGATIGSVIPGVGTVVGAGVGAGAGALVAGTKGFIEGKKKARAYDRQTAIDDIDAAQSASHQLSGKKDGGKIEGPGTAKSDSIKAEVKPGSFVVPAENAAQAERIRRLYLSPAGQANLNQDAGAPVKLSDGEHLFTPEEVVKLKARGINLDALAPNQKDGPGFKDGGGVDDVSKLIAQLEEQKKKDEAAQKARDEQYKKDEEAGRVDAIRKANYLKQKGEEEAAKKELDEWVEIVKSGIKPGMSYDPTGFTKSTHTISGDLEKLKAAKEKYDAVMGVPKNSANQITKDPGFVAAHSAYNAPGKQPAQNPQSATTTAATDNPNGVYTQKGNKWYDQNGNEVSGTSGKPVAKTGTGTSTTTPASSGEHELSAEEKAAQAAFLAEHNGPAPTPTETGKQATSTLAIDNLKAEYDKAETLADVTRIREQMHALGYNTDGTPIMSQQKQNAASVMADLAQGTANEDMDAETGAAEVPISGIRRVFDSLGGAGGTAALAQVGLGAYFSMKDKPPVDHIDPQLLAASQRAQKDASYGLSPEQIAISRGQIETNRRDVMNQINRNSGGNAGMGVANTRLAALDANQSNLGLALANQQAQQGKQAYADQMTGLIAAQRRRLFEDDQQRINMNQQVGANLISAGLSNFFGNMQFQDQQDRMDERQKKWGGDPWAAYNANQTSQPSI